MVCILILSQPLFLPDVLGGRKAGGELRKTTLRWGLRSSAWRKVDFPSWSPGHERLYIQPPPLDQEKHRRRQHKIRGHHDQIRRSRESVGDGFGRWAESCQEHARATFPKAYRRAMHQFFAPAS